jgi:hypothetical protein
MNNSAPLSAAPLTGHPFGDRFAARLMEFSVRDMPWNRRLWSPGTVLSLRELLEAGPWVDAQVLSPAALQWLGGDLERLAGDDAGIGGQEVRRHLRDTLHADLSEHSRHRRRLRDLISLVEESYLTRWAAALDSGRGVSAERLARAVAAHLLDGGYSMSFVYQVLRQHVTADATVGDLLEEAAVLAAAQPGQFEVLVPFLAVPQRQELAEALPEWRSGPQVREWLARHAPGDPTRHNGAFAYHVQAMDPYAAADTARESVDRLLARSRLTRRNRSGLKPVGMLRVAGLDEWLPVETPSRGVYLLSLHRERTLYRIMGGDLLDSAIELAAPLNRGSRVAAVAGGWAALESLLHHPGDPADRKDGRVIAAVRLAAIVTGSWPRAELTALSYAHRPGIPDLLARQLGLAVSNRMRASTVVAALRAGRQVSVRTAGDAAAAARMASLVAAPRQSLTGVRAAVEGSLRRLYRQRNIVLHGGSTESVALDAALRTAAPLVGAGLDRVAHAYLADGITPLALAATAETSLALAGAPDVLPVTDLLERNVTRAAA